MPNSRRSRSHLALIGSAAWALAACGLIPGPPVLPDPPKPNDFAHAARACDTDFPPRPGNYLAHAQCVNTADENYRLSYSPHEDLVRLNERLRLKFATQVDQGALPPAAGIQRTTEADRLVIAAMHDRDTGDDKTAEHRVQGLQAMLQR